VIFVKIIRRLFTHEFFRRRAASTRPTAPSDPMPHPLVSLCLSPAFDEQKLRAAMSSAATHQLDTETLMALSRFGRHGFREAATWITLGHHYRRRREPDDAIACYREALRLKPDDETVHLNIAHALIEAGRLDEAARHLDTFTFPAAAAEKLSEAWCRLGETALATRDRYPARPAFERCLQFTHRKVSFCRRIIKSCLDHDCSDTAHHFLDQHRRVLADQIHAIEGYLALQTDQFERAVQLLTRAAETDPGNPEVIDHLGIALQHTGKIHQAVALYEQALRSHPQALRLQFHLGIARLALRDFSAGWPLYELRRQLYPDRFPTFGLPDAVYDDLPQHHVLVYAEQGLGDEVMFAALLPRLATRARQVSYYGSPRLHTLFKRSFPGLQTLALPVPSTTAQTVDSLCPLGSLGRLLNVSATDLSTGTAYLSADPGRRDTYRRRLQQDPAILKIGLSWRGGTRQSRRSTRSVSLSTLAPLFHVPGCRFYSVQYGDVADEVAAFNDQTGFSLHHWPAANDDLEEQAALIDALDMIITVQTLVAHLGGALGKRVWVMLPVHPEWRYGYHQDRMLWYPDVHLFRQPRMGDWQGVVTELAHRLHRLCHGAASISDQPSA